MNFTRLVNLSFIISMILLLSVSPVVGVIQFESDTNQSTASNMSTSATPNIQFQPKSQNFDNQIEDRNIYINQPPAQKFGESSQSDGYIRSSDLPAQSFVMEPNPSDISIDAATVEEGIDTSLTFTNASNSDGHWEYHTVSTYDGVDSARSVLDPAAKGSTATISLQTTITGKGLFEFYWRQNGGVTLKFMVDGVEYANSISSGWEFNRISVETTGSHTIEFISEVDLKNGGSGSHGYLDQVSFFPGRTGDIDMTNPTTSSIWTPGSSNLLTWNNAYNIENVDIELWNGINYVSTFITNYEVSTYNAQFDFWTYTNAYTATLPSVLTPGTNYTIRLVDPTNLANNVTSDVFEVVADISVGDALEANYLNFTNNGDWSSYVEDTNDGTDAMKSVRASDRFQRKYLETTVEGKGNLTFFAKVIGASGDGNLEVYVDGVKQLDIASPSAWSSYSLILDTVQTHTITWAYYQVAYVWGDEYAGAIIDNVTWEIGADAINVIDPSSSSNWINGSTYDINWFYSGVVTDVTIELYKNSVFQSTIVASTTNDKSYSWQIPDSLVSGSDYQIKITSTTNSSATATSANFVITQLTLTEAIDYAPDSVVSGGNAAWMPTISISQDTEDSVQSGSISDNEISWFNMTVTGSGFLSFYWSVDSQVGDELQLYIDDVLITSISGSVSFNLVEQIISASGSHLISWSYSKDASGSAGSDAAWIDQVSFDTSADKILISTPTSTTSWLTNNTQTITWDHIGITNFVKIELYKAGSFDRTIISNTTNDGSFNWFISLYLSGASDYSIYIESLSDPLNNVESDQFTIDETAHIKVLNPISGSDWTRETTQTIQWNETGNIINVQIELYDNGVFVTTITSSTANDGSFSWTIGTGIGSGSLFTIVITATTDGSVTDTSDNFTISAPTITVTSPISSNIWTNNTKEFIRWTYTGVFANVIIELHNSTGLVLTISSLTANDGEFLWVIPTTIKEGDYSVRIISETDNSVIGISDTFSMQYPISLNEALDNYDLVFTNTGNYPWFGQQSHSSDGIDAARTGNFPLGSSSYLQTFVEGDGVLTFTYRHDGDHEWNDVDIKIDGITTMLPFSYATWTTYSMEIIGPESHEVEWFHSKVTGSNPSLNSAFLDNVTWTPYEPSIEINGPTNNTKMAVGGDYTVNFGTNGTFTNVDVRLYQSGTLAHTIYDGVYDFSTYTFTLDPVPAGTYQLRVSSSTNSSVYDEIDVIIEDEPVLTIFSPSSGMEWEQFSTYNIQWDVTGTVVTHVRLQLYKSTSQVIDFGILPDNGSLTWTVPDTLVRGSDYRFRITSANQTVFTQYSDYFSIDEIHDLAVIQPTSSTGWPNATDVNIQWISNGTFSDVTIEIWSGGSYYATIIASTPNDGSYLWSIPADFTLGTYQIYIHQSNDGSINALSETFQIIENINLDEASDNTLGLETGGDSIWIGQSTTSFNDNDALESGAIADNQQVWIEYTIFGSGTLSFYWKVSSQSTDYLTLYIDGVLITQISGEVDWVQYTTSVLDGGSNHTIRWVYQKDASGIAGLDKAWLDLITWIEDSDSINVPYPTSSDTLELGSYGLTWTSLGTIERVNITLYLNGSFVQLIAGNLLNDGTFTFTVTEALTTGSGYEIRIFVADNGAVYGSSQTFSIFILDFNEAVDNLDLTIRSGGWYEWTVTESVFYQGGDAVRAGIVPGSKVSWIEFDVNGTGWFYFYLKFDVGFLDDVDILVNGFTREYLDGVMDWTLFSIYLDDARINTIRIVYDNYSSADSSEFVYVDAVSWVPDNEAIKITGPANNSNYTTGDTYTLYWNFNGTSPYVRIDYYQLGVIVHTTTTLTQNDGYYYTSIPSLANGQYQVRIASTSDGSIFGEITINIVDPYVSINAPTSTSEVEIGQSFAITFDYLGDDNFIIDLYLNGTFHSQIYQYERNGYYVWTPSDSLQPGIGYQINVTYSTDTSVFALSESFEILPKRSLSVTSPTTDSIWLNSTSVTITWNSQGPVDFVNISLYLDSAYYLSVVNMTANDGSYSWVIPIDLVYSANYQIKIVDSTDSIISSTSSNFVISHPISVISPDNASIYGNMTTQTIVWFGVDTISNVDIKLYIDGVFVEDIAVGIVNSGTFTWYIEDYYSESSQVYIIIQDSSNPSVYDRSETFTIDKADISPNNAIDNYDVTLSYSGVFWFGQNTTTHDGSDALQSNPIGDSQETSMFLTVFGTGTLSFWVKASTEYNDDKYYIYTPGLTYVRSGSSAWEQIVVDITSSGYTEIEFRYKKDFLTSSYLDAVFLDQVVWTPDPSSIFVESPANGDVLAPGSTYTIDWTTTGNVASVYLQLYLSGSYVMNITDSLQNVVSYAWTIPTDITPGLYYTIKVISLIDSSVNDLSGEFEIATYVSAQEALDTSEAVTVDSNWIGQTNITYDGFDALFSQEVGEGDYDIVITVEGTGTFSFVWKHTTGSYGIYVDGQLKYASYGGRDWGSRSYQITSSGSHTITWRFSVTYNTDSDYAWLDGFTWTPENNGLSNAETDASSYYEDEAITLTWSSTGSITKVNIYLVTGSLIIGEILDVQNDGSILLTLPNGLEYRSDYFLRIEAANDNSIYTDTATFAILETLYLNINDNFKASYNAGETVSITWDGSSSLDPITIYLVSGNSIVLTIVTDTANDGTYSWTIPGDYRSGTFTILLSSSGIDSESSSFDIIESENNPDTSEDPNQDPTTDGSDTTTTTPPNEGGDESEGGFLPFNSILFSIIILNLIALLYRKRQ